MSFYQHLKDKRSMKRRRILFTYNWGTDKGCYALEQTHYVCTGVINYKLWWWWFLRRWWFKYWWQWYFWWWCCQWWWWGLRLWRWWAWWQPGKGGEGQMHWWRRQHQVSPPAPMYHHWNHYLLLCLFTASIQDTHQCGKKDIRSTSHSIKNGIDKLTWI